AATGVPAHTASLNPNHQAPALAVLHHHDSKSRQSENPRTIAPRSHRSSLVGSHQERTPSNSGWPTWDRALRSRPPSRPPTPTAVRAGGRIILNGTVTQIAFHSRDGKLRPPPPEIGYTSSLVDGEAAMRPGWSALLAWLTTMLIVVSVPTLEHGRPSPISF